MNAREQPFVTCKTVCTYFIIVVNNPISYFRGQKNQRTFMNLYENKIMKFQKSTN